VKAGSKKLTVKWKKGKDIDGYEIEYSQNKDFSDSKTKTVTKADTEKTELKKLTKKKTYYVRMRAYKTVDGKKYYSEWSKSKSEKVK
jgi:predicted  nucleic acid-binding Zn ribbon protein